MQFRRAVAARAGAFLALAALAATLPGPAPAVGAATGGDRPRVLHVSGSAGAPGDGSAARPYRRISQALAVAVAGDTILVGRGRYAEPVTTVRPGRPDAPIRIVGWPGAHLVGTRGLRAGRLVQVLHDDVTVESLELSDASKLVWVQGARGVRILGNRIHDAGRECVRLKGSAKGNEIAGNLIGRCGRIGFSLARGEKNGEGVYIGTAPEQAGAGPDRSDGNWVHGNRITPAAECVDVKEEARGNRVEHNRCTGGDDPDGAGFSSRGDGTSFCANISTHHAGAGVRLGGDGPHQGLHNTVTGNILADNAGYGIKVMRAPQGRIAGNLARRNGKGPTNRRS